MPIYLPIYIYLQNEYVCTSANLFEQLSVIVSRTKIRLVTYCLFGVKFSFVIESALLSKDELLTPNIDEIMAV